MKRILAVLTLALCASAVMAQEAPQAPVNEDLAFLIAQGPGLDQAPTPPPDGQYKRMSPDGPRDMGPGPGEMKRREPMKFWNNSEIATKINLTDQQKQQLETTFTNYRLKLIDQRAAVEREQVKLEPLIQADKLDEGAITKQIDSLISARGQLERTMAMMGVDIRKVLTTEQWKQLKTLHHGIGMGMGLGRGEGGDRRDFRGRRGGWQGDGQAPAAPKDGDKGPK